MLAYILILCTCSRVSVFRIFDQTVFDFNRSFGRYIIHWYIIGSMCARSVLSNHVFEETDSLKLAYMIINNMCKVHPRDAQNLRNICVIGPQIGPHSFVDYLPTFGVHMIFRNI